MATSKSNETNTSVQGSTSSNPSALVNRNGGIKIDTQESTLEKSKVAKSGTGQLSEHGHHLQEIRPMAKHSGKSVVTFFTGLFQTMIAISTLGTSVTFSFILTGNTQLGNPTGYYREGQIVTFLAISWLLFLLNLAFASLGSTLLTFFKAHWVRDWDGEHGIRSQLEVQLYAVLVSGLLGGLIVGAFVFLCLVVVAYSPVVGWIALGFTSWFGLIIAVSVTWQLPWPWRDNTPDEGRKTP